MAASVRKANSSDAYPVYQLLRDSTLNARTIPLEDRRRMFQPRWGGTEDYYGYILDDGGVVGFLGLLFTTQRIGGKDEQCCELHSWYVKDEYRNDSIRLLMPALSLRGFTLLNYTPTRPVYDISVKFGFEDLESRLRLVYPVPTPGSFSRRIRTISDKHIIAGRLQGIDKQVFMDHHDLRCEHLLLVDRRSREECYVMVKRLRRRWFEPFLRVLYVSHPEFFLDSLDYLRTHLCLRYRTQCLALSNEEFLNREVPHSRLIERDVPSLIKSRNVSQGDVRPLYNLPLLIGYNLH